MSKRWGACAASSASAGSAAARDPPRSPRTPSCLGFMRRRATQVVDTVKTSDMAKKGVFCRCWRSSKFPM